MTFRFKNFKVYQDAKDFCRLCREIIDKQNIAEGSADNSDTEFARFLGISIRSVYEVVAGFDMAFHYKMINDELNIKIENKAEGLVKQLSVFRSSLKN